jgi:type II secretory pathway pseudopilin PulG
VVAIIGILVAIAVPGFVRARTNSRARACQENLSKLDGGKEQYALDNNLAPGAAAAMSDICLEDGTLYVKAPATGPVCPGGGAYTLNTIGVDPTCSIGATIANAPAHALP